MVVSINIRQSRIKYSKKGFFIGWYGKTWAHNLASTKEKDNFVEEEQSDTEEFAQGDWKEGRRAPGWATE